MDSISIEIRENERCPVGLEILLNQSKFIVSLNPKGGVGDFEIINSQGEVILIGQKHLNTISLLEHTSRSEVLTLDLSNVTKMTLSCPPTEEIALITNTRMGLFHENTLEIQGESRSDQKQYNFKFQRCKSTTHSSKGGSNTPSTNPSSNPDADGEKHKYNFQVVNDGFVVVAELSICRLSSKVAVHLPGQVPLTPVQAAVIFGGLAFQIYAMKNQKSWLVLLTTGSLFAFIIIIIIICVMFADGIKIAESQ